MRALITGINGFVGPYLKSELEQNGYEVFGLGREKAGKANYFEVDITDSDELSRIIKQIEPEYVFHLAGISSPILAREEEELTHKVNVVGTKNLLESAAKHSTHAKVLITSSAHVYGQAEYFPIDEKHPLNGKGSYANSRQGQEEAARAYFDKLNIVIARSFNHTGPAQPDTFVLPKIVKQIVEIKKGKSSYLELGNVEVKRDFSDVRDVVRAYRILLEQDNFGIIVNVCRGESISLKKAIEYVRVMAGLESLDIRVSEDFIRKNDAPDMYGSHKLLTELTGWQPEISYEQMLEDMYDYWLNNV